MSDNHFLNPVVLVASDKTMNYCMQILGSFTNERVQTNLKSLLSLEYLLTILVGWFTVLTDWTLGLCCIVGVLIYDVSS